MTSAISCMPSAKQSVMHVVRRVVNALDSVSPTAIAWTQAPRITAEDGIVSSRTGIQQAWIDRERDLARFHSFKNNWDDLGAEAPDPRVITARIFSCKS